MNHFRASRGIGCFNVPRRVVVLTIAAMALVLPSCESGGHFTLLGYTSRPNYDANVHTVYVPIFQNKTYKDTVRRTLEFDLTQAVVREIEAKTPYKVVSNPDCADTELLGTIIGVAKNLLNLSQENEVRQAETVITVELVWRDLHTGEVLSKPRKPMGGVAISTPSIDGIGMNPNGVPNPGAVGNLAHTTASSPDKIVIQSNATYIPELGQSNTSALQDNVNRLAVQIVSMMESPW